MARSKLEVLRTSWLNGLGSERTRDAYGRDLEAFIAWCGEQGTSPLEEDPGVERYRDSCEEDGARPSTIARRLAALASFYDHALAEQAVEANPVDDVERPAKARGSTSSELAEREALALFHAASALGSKVAVLVAMLLFEGMKLGEVLALDVEALDGSGWAMRATVTRRGRPMVVPLDGRTAQAVTAHLDGRTIGPLLVGDSPTRELGGASRLTRFGADFLLKRAAAHAGIERNVSANVLRRSYISLAHRDGTSVEDIQHHVGHASARDTRRFLP